jgi:hypothetical protein
LSHIKDSLWWVLAIALVVRGGALWFGQADLHDDPDAYTRLATNWSRTGMFGFDAPDGSMQPTAYRPPLYPWLLSWLAVESNVDRQSPAESGAYPWLFSWMNVESPTVSPSPPITILPVGFVAALHLLLGLATVGLTWSIARDLRIGWPALAALLVACDPILVRASQLVMTETLAAFLALVAWKLWLVVYPPILSELSIGQCGPTLRRRNPPSNTVPRSLQCGPTLRRRNPLDNNALRSLPQWFALLGLGFVFGVSILARPTAAPWAVLCLLGICFFSSQCWKRRINDSLIVGLLVVACLAPWVLRNLSVLGKPIWATTHGGYTLLLANNPLIYQHFKEHGPSRNWDAEPFHARWAERFDPGQPLRPFDEAFWFGPLEASGQSPVPLHELADDQMAYMAALGPISREPLMFALSGLYRVGWLWAAWPNTGPRIARLAIGLWYISLFVAAILGVRQMVRRIGFGAWIQVWWLPLMLVVSLTLIHFVYWSNMRMRAPACAVLAIAAAASVRKRAASNARGVAQSTTTLLSIGLGVVFLASELPAQTLHTLGEIQREAKLKSIGSNGALSFLVAGREATIPAERIVRWGAWSGVLDDQAVWLSDDSFVCGQVSINTTGVTLTNDWLQAPSLAWKLVRGLVLAPPRTLDNWLTLHAQMQSASGEEDRVWLVDGKRLSGIVRVGEARDVRGEPTLHVDSSGQSISLRLTDIQAIVFSPTLLGSVPEHHAATQLSLVDGSRLWTTQFDPSSTGMELALECGLELQSIDESSVFTGAILGIARPSAATTFLSDLTPARYRHLPDSTLSWELGADRDVMGGALHTEQTIFLRGLATHSSSQVAYRWDGSPVRMLAEVTLAAALPGAAERLGSVSCQILIAREGKLQTAHSFSLQRAAEGTAQPVEMIDLELQHAQLIVLVTDKADYGQYGDHVLWLDARLHPK